MRLELVAPAFQGAAVHGESYSGPCDESLRLRQRYIDELGGFNQAAATHRLVLRAGLEGPAFEHSWRKFQDGCAASREAFSRYRQHVAAHHCKRS